jgi:hypothetical protein
MLFPICPHTFIPSSVRPHKFTEPFFLVVYIVSLEYSLVWPSEGALSIHHVVVPVPFILPTILPFVATEARDVVVVKLAVVC